MTRFLFLSTDLISPMVSLSFPAMIATYIEWQKKSEKLTIHWISNEASHGKRLSTLSPVTTFQVCTRSLGATHGARLNKRVLIPCALNRCIGCVAGKWTKTLWRSFSFSFNKHGWFPKPPNSSSSNTVLGRITKIYNTTSYYVLQSHIMVQKFYIKIRCTLIFVDIWIHIWYRFLSVVLVMF